MTDRLHLEPRHREVLEALLREHLPDVEVWACGSRVNGRSHDGSDLDLVLRGPGLKEIPAANLADFEEALQESNIPFLVEARDWARLPERFHQEIEREHVVLVGAGSSSKFKTTALGEVTKLTLSSVDKKTKKGETNVLLCNYMDVYSRRLIRAEMPFMAATATKREIERCGLQAEDVVITKDSEKHDDIGVPALIRENVKDLVCGYHLAILRPLKDELHGPYLFYALQTEETRHQFHSYANGVTRFGLRKNDILRVEISFPPLSEQRAIAHVLGALDDKIELNRRMNQTLEAMAQAIFKDWFVDFGPVRAKTEGREPYLPPEIWKLFPDALDDEGKPFGWMTYTLSDLAHHHRATLSPGAQPERIYEHYSIPAYDAGNEPATDFGGSIKSNKTIVPEDAVLLSKLNPEIERVWLPNSNIDAPQIASTEFLTLTSLAPATRNVLYFLFGSPGFRVQMAARVTGTSKSHQRVPPKSLLACEVLTANPKLLALFDGKIGPMVRRLLSNRRESLKLSQTRDLLLSKLISGEIRLRDAEKEDEAVA